MNQNLLLKYISGKASQREKEEVASWMDADAANLLTSSTCHPKLIGEQWSDSLVPFHNHCFAYNILVER